MKSEGAPSGLFYALERWEWSKGSKIHQAPLKLYSVEKNPDARDVAISEFNHHYSESVEARVAHEYALHLMKFANGKPEFKRTLLSYNYDAVIQGLAFEATYLSLFRPDNAVDTKPLNEVIGNDPKKMGIFTHHVSFLGMEKYPEIITKHSDILIHQMQDRINFLWELIKEEE